MNCPPRWPRLDPTSTASHPIAPPRAPAFDWAEVRDGAREVFLTVTATILLGLGWAALEAGLASASRAPAGGAASVGTGYASMSPPAR